MRSCIPPAKRSPSRSKIAEKPADEGHPYGHARVEYLSGLVVAALILIIGVELAKTSVEKI